MKFINDNWISRLCVGDEVIKEVLAANILLESLLNVVIIVSLY